MTEPKDIPIEQISAGHGRAQRRKIEREICSQRNRKPPRFTHDRVRPWEAIQHMISKKEVTPIEQDQIMKNDLKIMLTLQSIFSADGSSKADDLSSIEQYSLMLFFLTHALIDATKPQDKALAMPQWNTCLDSAEDAQRAHIAMQQRFNKSGRIGWSAEDKLAIEDCTARISELMNIATIGMARGAIVQAKTAIDDDFYKANRARYLEGKTK